MIGYLRRHCHCVVESPAVTLPSRPLVTSPSRLLASPLIVLSLHHPLILSLRRLVVVALPLGAPPSRPLVILSLRRPLAVSSRRSSSSHCAALLSSNRAGWLMCRLSPRRRLVFLSCRTLVFLSSSHCAALLSSHHVVWLLRRLLSHRHLVLLSSSHSQRHSRRPRRWRSLSPAAPDVECCRRGGPRHRVTVALTITLDAVSCPLTLSP
jgi:hypothetical protein